MMEEIFDAAQAIKRIVKTASDAGFLDGDELTEILDEAVHDIISHTATEINNNGNEAQIEFIITSLGPKGVKSLNETLNAMSKGGD